MQFERYAIYWAPKAGSSFAKFGRNWLGGDPETGRQFDERSSLGLPAELAEAATASPRRYGLHATIKAPFRLAPGVEETALGQALAAFCARRRRVAAGPLTLHRFSRFLALVPKVPRAELEWLADEAVTHFDPFRAPLDDADRARRSGHLTALESAHFEEFGYPYIFSSFMFHITLAGPLNADDLARAEAALAPAVAPYMAGEFVVDELCLFGDPGGGGLFKILGRYPLRS
jgi:2'-5' RNA ligase